MTPGSDSLSSSQVRDPDGHSNIRLSSGCPAGQEWAAAKPLDRKEHRRGAREQVKNVGSTFQRKKTLTSGFSPAGLCRKGISWQVGLFPGALDVAVQVPFF